LTRKSINKDDEIKFLKALIEQQKKFQDEMKKSFILEQEQANAKVTGTENGAILKGVIEGEKNVYTQSVFGTWQQLEFHRLVTANYLSIGFYSDSRIFTFDLEISSDGQNWKTLKQRETALVSASFSFDTTSFKYLRIQGRSTLNAYLHITHFKLKYFPS